MTTTIGCNAEHATPSATRLTISTRNRRIESSLNSSIRLSMFHSTRQSRSIVRAQRCAIRRKPKVRIMRSRPKHKTNFATAGLAADDNLPRTRVPITSMERGNEPRGIDQKVPRPNRPLQKDKGKESCLWCGMIYEARRNYPDLID